jgi:hypothetical protein
LREETFKKKKPKKIAQVIKKIQVAELPKKSSIT